MKLIVAIVRDHDADAVLSALVEKDLRVTRTASSGGFLRRGNATFWIGIEDERVDEALDVIRAAVAQSESEPGQRKAMVFVLNVARFEQL
ncbi:MAG: cyclic-di-AMP receptor [Chloroflexota bacterium]